MKAVQDFSPKFDLEDLIEKLIFIEKVEKGLFQIEEGKTVSHDKVKEIVSEW